uniref:Serine/threonine-protein phosphatase 4 regulatory subunit 2 n=1 Tax=Anopheles dirus TaxID=7168 RepID=A0A182N4V6_9DIPT
MTMENQEEILLLLERFTKSKQKDIPRELEDYLNFVARTGDTLYRWVLVKPLFREKLVNVITDFHHNTPSIADIPQCPNVDPFNFERMKRSLLERLDSFNSAPFTVQRICELLTEPRKQYTRIDKFMRAVEKNILVLELGGNHVELLSDDFAGRVARNFPHKHYTTGQLSVPGFSTTKARGSSPAVSSGTPATATSATSVVSTQEPGRRRSDSENGDSLDSIVNGDLEVNVDIEMDNEQFHLEADALLPDSSDPVGSLHSSLVDVGASQRVGEGSEMNGGRVVGTSFLNSDDANQSGKGGLHSDTHQSVIDTNENATDGDIAAPLLEASLETSPPMPKDTNERLEKEDATGKAPIENSTTNEKDESVQAVREDEHVREAETREENKDEPQAATVDSETEQVDENKSHTTPTASDNVDVKELQTTDDDGEPQAKMVKHDDVASATDVTDSASASKAEVPTSTEESDAPPVVAKAPSEETKPPCSDGSDSAQSLAKLVDESDKENVLEASSISPPAEKATETSSESETIDVAIPAKSNLSIDGQQHSSGESDAISAPVPTEATVAATGTSVAEMEASSSSETTVGASVDSTPELEMELAAVATAASATTGVAVPAAEAVLEEVDMAGEPAATEMAAEEDPKADDNVMDIDESSVEMMDQ